jgi:hypothetical protein
MSSDAMRAHSSIRYSERIREGWADIFRRQIWLWSFVLAIGIYGFGIVLVLSIF